MPATWTTVQTLIPLDFRGWLIPSPPCARAPAQCQQWPIGPTNDPPADWNCQLSMRLSSAPAARRRTAHSDNRGVPGHQGCPPASPDTPPTSPPREAGLAETPDRRGESFIHRTDG